MKRKSIILILLVWITGLQAQEFLPLKGLAVALPDKDNLDRFVDFINTEMKSRGVNTLILRVDYNYEYKSHPELVNKNALTEDDIDKIVKACGSGNIQLIPQINLLGHQSWAETNSKLLEVYPEFDETPHVKLPEKYEWPNPDDLYCKSYCPLHPKVHEIVFDLVDEITQVFQSDAFHAGMDEVFYIGDAKCPRCAGLDKAELFAGEVTLIRNHLASKGKRLWIWGDRLIDAKYTGMGMWEASMNNTHRAIHMIPKDVMICDWHYERPDPTAVYFAMNGLDVASCSWKNTEVAIAQKSLLESLREGATDQMKSHYRGMIQTVWTSAGNFLDMYFSKNSETDNEAVTFKTLFPYLKNE